MTEGICLLFEKGKRKKKIKLTLRKKNLPTIVLVLVIKCPSQALMCPALRYLSKETKKTADRYHTNNRHYLLYYHSFGSCAIKSWISSMILWSYSMCQMHQRLCLVCDKLLLSCTAQRENILSVLPHPPTEKILMKAKSDRKGEENDGICNISPRA